MSNYRTAIEAGETHEQAKVPANSAAVNVFKAALEKTKTPGSDLDLEKRKAAERDAAAAAARQQSGASPEQSVTVTGGPGQVKPKK